MANKNKQKVVQGHSVNQWCCPCFYPPYCFKRSSCVKKQVFGEPKQRFKCICRIYFFFFLLILKGHLLSSTQMSSHLKMSPYSLVCQVEIFHFGIQGLPYSDSTLFFQLCHHSYNTLLTTIRQLCSLHATCPPCVLP